MQLKWKRLPFFRIETITPKGLKVVIGKDSGSMDLNTYYYIEIDDEIVEHGFVRQKEAKEHLIKYYDL